MQLRPGRLSFVATLLLMLSHPATALEYRNTARPALLYDAPSTAARKVAIAGSGLPLEIVVNTEAWVKVRDHSGRLAWLEKSALGDTKNVMVKAATSAVRGQPRADAEVAFHAERGVLLEATGEADPYGWLPVRHIDGLAGWLPSHAVWGW